MLFHIYMQQRKSSQSTTDFLSKDVQSLVGTGCIMIKTISYTVVLYSTACYNAACCNGFFFK